jgi:signal transduction histidine kinase
VTAVPLILTRLRILAVGCGILAALAGVANLAGWAWDNEFLRALAPGLIVMLPWTATGFVAGGISLALQMHRAPRPAVRVVARVAAAYVLLLGLVSGVQRIMGITLPTDLMLFGDKVAAYPFLPLGVMAINSAIAFTLLGAALLSLDVELGRGRRPAQWAALLAGALIGIALVGYLYQVRPMYAMERASGMALMAALSFAVLTLGTLVARPSTGAVGIVTAPDIGGALARRLLPTVVLLPLLLGWIWMKLDRAGQVSVDGAIPVFVLAFVATVALLVLDSARRSSLADRERTAALLREEAATAAAIDAQHEAEQASRAKSDFLATMSHELRTPLNAIIGYSALMREGIPEPVTAGQAGQLDRIGTSAQHLLALIEEVLSVARIEAGKESVTVQAVSVDALLDDTLAMSEPLARSKGLRLDVRRPEVPTTIRTDARKARQALLNLVANAIKFTDVGTVTVTARCTGTGVAFSVADTGPGIAPENIGRIFEPFWQVEQSHRRTVSGAGLGLTLTQRFARMLGGEISVSSSVGTGSTFLLTLPLEMEPRATPAGSTAPATQDPSTAH